MHEAIAAEDLHTLVYRESQDFAALHLGDGGLNGILLDCFKSGFGVVAGAAPGLLDVSSSAENLALGSIGCSSYAGQLLFNQAKLVQELAKGLTLRSVCSGEAQRTTRATYGTCTQLQSSDIEDVESNLVSFVNLAQQVLYRNSGILKVDLAS